MRSIYVNNPLPEYQFQGIFPKITSGTSYYVFQDFNLTQHVLRNKQKNVNEKTISRDLSRVKRNNN